ncbi:MAG: MopE-related protein [Polyangiaceae bacterium]
MPRQGAAWLILAAIYVASCGGSDDAGLGGVAGGGGAGLGGSAAGGNGGVSGGSGASGVGGASGAAAMGAGGAVDAGADVSSGGAGGDSGSGGSQDASSDASTGGAPDASSDASMGGAPSGGSAGVDAGSGGSPSGGSAGVDAGSGGSPSGGAPSGGSAGVDAGSGGSPSGGAPSDAGSDASGGGGAIDAGCSVEVCDGKDNDCDGKIDEDDPAAGTHCTVPSKLGECAKGVLACVKSKLVCAQVNFPAQEQCNGKDDDCDGAVDETDPLLGQSCVVAGQSGVCMNGKYLCQAGQLLCGQNPQAAPEKCRNNLDDDCDGSSDEICGRTYSFVKIGATGTITKMRGFQSVGKLGTGTYSLTATTESCPTSGLVVAPSSSSLRPVSVTCSGADFVVRIGNQSGTATDWDFSAVVAPAHADEMWAYVKSNGAITTSSGAPTVSHISTGAYEVTHAACQSNRAVLANVLANALAGYVTTSANAGKCDVRTYDLAGANADLGFVLWAPSATGAAFATVSAAGTVTGSNTFGDQYATWTATPIYDAGNALLHYRVAYTGYSSTDSVAIVSSRTMAVNAAVVPSTQYAQVYPRSIVSAAVSSADFSILFVQ